MQHLFALAAHEPLQCDDFPQTGHSIATQFEAARGALGSVGIQLHQKQRAYDTLTWAHATNGFFKLQKKIPTILNGLGLADA